MGDSRRFHEFVKVIRRIIPIDSNVADVAGGKGYLQAAMRQLGYDNVTSWDKRKKYASNRRGYRYGWFEWDTAPEYDAVVAMHPDEGTDHAILYAARHRVPAIVCPCCVKPSGEVYCGAHEFRAWCEHLERLATQRGCDVKWTALPINGRNLVMIVTPNCEVSTAVRLP